MSRFTFGKKGRRAALLGAAGLGVCAALAACSPVQAGSAAIVGNQRITSASLDSQVSNLQASIKQYNPVLQQIRKGLGQAVPLNIDSSPLSRVVLNWKINFAIYDRMAADKGISVTPAQGAAALSQQAAQTKASLPQEFLQIAEQEGMSAPPDVNLSGFNENAYLTLLGIPVQMSQQAGRYLAQETAFEGKFGNNASAFTKSQCTAAKTLNIQVSPQFGRFNYAVDQNSGALTGLVPADDTLSRPAGTPSPADTTGLTPQC